MIRKTMVIHPQLLAQLHATLKQEGQKRQASMDGMLDNRLLACGIRLIESPLATEPRRMHKKRRWMSMAYHRRIQKKWNRRFGFKPGAFFVDTPVVPETPLPLRLTPRWFNYGISVNTLGRFNLASMV